MSEENIISNIKVDGVTYALNDSSKATIESIEGLISISTENQSSIESANSKLDELLSKVESSGLDTSDATATAANILLGQTAYVNGVKVTGTLDLSQLLPENIISGIVINGVEGSHICENNNGNQEETDSVCCAQCWLDGEDQYYYTPEEFKNHGHSEVEGYRYPLSLKVTGNSNKLKIGDYVNNNFDEGLITEIDSDENNEKTDIYDFTWSFNEIYFIIDEQGSSVDVFSDLKYNHEINKWVIEFYTINSDTEEKTTINVYELKDGKTPLGMSCELDQGEVEVVLNE